jgi:hypothetical protein
MEAANVKTDEQLRTEWINRPANLKQFSFAEWKDCVAGEARGLTQRTAVADQDIREYPGIAGSNPASRARHETGKMNKLEAKYAAHLELRKTTREISDWRFEPMKLRLAPRTYFDVDFAVRYDWLLEDGAEVAVIELHEVKGHWEDDARVKMKVAATMFPWWTFRGVQWDKAAKDWKFEEFKA